MSRRRNRDLAGMGQATVDPGKDLFAYLFILIMVFSFMLLMTTEERHSRSSSYRAPQNAATGHSTLARVRPAAIGHLEKRDGAIVLVFAGKSYDPLKDVAGLERDGRVISRQDEDGVEQATLYLAADNASLVSLAEYLEAFRSLGEHGINVAFAERVH